MLGCVIGGVGMAGMPYPPNLCASVPICGRLSLQECSVCSAYSVGTLSLFALLVLQRQLHQRGSILPRNSRNVRLRYWRRGYGRMPYPPNLCASVPICGRHFSARMFCVFCVFCGNTLPVCFVGNVVVFSHGIHRMLGCVIGGVGMAGMPYPPNLCASVPICGRHFSARRFCVFCVFCGEFVHCFVGAARLVHLRQVHPLRVPPESAPSAIGLRPPPDRIASAVQSDSVRHPVRFRSLHDAISSVCTLRRLRCNTPHVPLLHPFMFAKLRNKFDF